MAYSGSLVNTQIYYTLMQWNHMAAVDDQMDDPLCYTMPDTGVSCRRADSTYYWSMVRFDLDVWMFLFPQFTQMVCAHRDTDKGTKVQESYHIVAPFVELVRFLHP